MNEKVPYRLAYKLTIALLIITIGWIVNFNRVTSQVYENEIAEYRNRIEYDQEYRTKSMNVIHKLLNKSNKENIINATR